MLRSWKTFWCAYKNPVRLVKVTKSLTESAPCRRDISILTVETEESAVVSFHL